MNPTIEKIVNLLFEDLKETEETNAIRDEILTNCQERYQDMIESGMKEDDAVAAVLESLKGMEDMLENYPRKSDEPEPEAQEPETQEEQDAPFEEASRTWNCDPAQSFIREIRMKRMGSAKVTVRPSEDHLLHVECFNPQLTLLTGLQNGVLTIALNEEQQKDDFKFSLDNGFDFAKLGRMFEKFTRRVISNFGETEITLSIPTSIAPVLYIGTVSGNVTIEPITLERLNIVTASGNMELDSVFVHTELRATSVNGNLEARSCCVKGNVRLNTTNGDINWTNQSKTLNVSTITGDITMAGETETIAFRTVSGDVELKPVPNQFLVITGGTTSGDVDIALPEETSADVSCSAVTGHVRSQIGSVPGASVVIKLNTVSGDIKVI